MSLSADRLLDRIRLKSEINRWRSLTIVVAVLFGLSVVSNSVDLSGATGDYIARISVTGIILEDSDRDQRLKAVRDDKHVKAVVVYVNSPGGTIVGGETIYRSLRDIAKVKPVVAVMGSVAASGGYMAAIAADRIFTRSGTITGSIGVMMQTAEFTGMAKKLGVKFITFKSGEMKGSPSPMEKLDPKVATVIDAGIADGYEFFLELVKDRRPLSGKELRDLSDGRIFTGRQAVANKLVDSLGGEDEAVKWLVSEKKISAKLKVKDVELKDKKDFLSQIYSKVMGSGTSYISQMLGNGMMVLWKPSIIN
jgi:protease-4